MAAVYGYPFFNVILTLRIEAFYKCFRQSYIVGIRLSPKFQCTRERNVLLDRDISNAFKANEIFT